MGVSADDNNAPSVSDDDLAAELLGGGDFAPTPEPAPSSTAAPSGTSPQSDDDDASSSDDPVIAPGSFG